ncbi:MAG TPA: hypothetical protein VD794_12730, partial [Flavisolibacter sp.]|nr:hypothetical protein [Flavisolibacter sp.]
MKKHYATCCYTSKRLFTKRPHKTFLAILVVGLLVFNDARLIAAAYDMDSPSPFVIIPAYFISFLLIPALLLNQNIIIRTIIQILLFSSIYTDVLYLLLSNFPFSFPDAINMFNNPEYASGALLTFTKAFLVAFALASMVYATILYILKDLTFLVKPIWLLLFITIQVAFFLYTKHHAGITDFFPSLYRVTGNLINANRFRPEEQWRRDAVSQQPNKRKAEQLYFIVDESITGSTLSINGYQFPTTPFLQANASRFINFGNASSFTNFSAGSNLSLMSGMLTKEFPDKHYRSFSKPSLFQYAKKSGYQTYLLDAQSKDGKLQNYITHQDLSYIDSF